MGGTFDPIHLGHLVTAEQARVDLGLDEVIFMPAGEPWQKTADVTSAGHRYLMAVLATAANPHFSVSRLEIDHLGPTYTVDTLRRIRDLLEEQGINGGRDSLYFITGADAIANILTWKAAEECLELATVVAATRPVHDLAHLEREGLRGKVLQLAVPALAISFWRNALATAVLAPYAVLRHRADLRALRGRRGALAVAAGALLALHFAAWVPSLAYTSVASSTALVCLQAVWTVVFARLAGHAVSARVWVGTGVALLGAAAVTGVDVSLTPGALVGDLLALLGGVFSGAYVVVGAEVRRTVSTTAYTLVCYGSCSLLLLIACLVTKTRLGGYPAQEWTKLLVLTVVAQLLGHSVFNRVLRTTNPVLVSLTILLEVPGAALLAAIFLDQVPPAAVFPAVGLILAGIAIVVTAQRKREPAPVPVE